MMSRSVSTRPPWSGGGLRAVPARRRGPASGCIRRVRPGAIPGSPPAHADRLLPLVRGVRARRPRRPGRARRGGRLPRAVDLRPLPPVERRAGPQRLRVVGHRRALAGHDLPVTTGVTCPTVRIHPAIIAQAAATSGVLLEGRFNLGVGSGEALNEHILGDRWPEADVRLEMLEEAVEVIRTLWQGGQRSHHGRHYTSRTRASTTCPTSRRRSSSPASGRRRSSSRRASATASAPPRPTRTRSTSTARRAARARSTPGPRSASWPTRTRRVSDRPPAVAQRGAAGRARPGPPHAGALRAGLRARRARAARHARRPRLEQHVDRCSQYADAGVDELFVQQIGPEQDAFFGTWAREVLPRFASAGVR